MSPAAKPSNVSELREGAEAIAEQTPDVDSPPVWVAWRRVMDDVQAVGKTGHNKQQDYNFRGVDAVVNAAGPAVRRHGVTVMPCLKRIEYRDVEVGKNRTLMSSVRIEVRYSIVGPRGDVFTTDDPDFGKVAAEAMDAGDKATSKAMSVAERTFLIQALMLPTHQPDPDEQSYERSAAPAPQPSPKALAKAVVLQLVDGDKAKAAEVWAGIDGDSQRWGSAPEQEVTLLYDEWVNQPKDPAEATE